MAASRSDRSATGASTTPAARYWWCATDRLGRLPGAMPRGCRQGVLEFEPDLVRDGDGERAVRLLGIDYHYSLRRSAATNPTGSSAVSRSPARSGSGDWPLIFQTLVGGQAVSTSNSSGGISGVPCSGGAPWVRRMPYQTATTRALAIGSAWLRNRAANRIAGSREPPAHGADLRPGPGQLGEVAGDRARCRRQRVQPVGGAPAGELGPVRPVAAQRVRRPGGLDVPGLVLGQRGVRLQLERVGHGRSTRYWRSLVGSVMIGRIGGARRDSGDHPVYRRRQLHPSSASGTANGCGSRGGTFSGCCVGL